MSYVEWKEEHQECRQPHVVAGGRRSLRSRGGEVLFKAWLSHDSEWSTPKPISKEYSVSFQKSTCLDEYPQIYKLVRPLFIRYWMHHAGEYGRTVRFPSCLAYCKCVTGVGRGQGHGAKTDRLVSRSIASGDDPLLTFI